MFRGAVEAAKKEGGTVVYGGKVMKTLSSGARDFDFLSLRYKQDSGQIAEGSPTAIFLLSSLL